MLTAERRKVGRALPIHIPGVDIALTPAQIRVLVRVLDLYDRSGHIPISICSVAHADGCRKFATWQILQTLARKGLVELISDTKYCVRPLWRLTLFAPITSRAL